MKNLEQLDISANLLSTFSLNFLPRLKKINLNKNQLQKLQLSSYIRVSIVNAARNKLKNIPTFHDNNQIKLLNLQHNYIEEISHALLSSTNLKTLNLSSNRLKIIPHLLQHLDLNEKSLNLQNNPIQSIQCINYTLAKCGHNFINEFKKKDNLINQNRHEQLEISQTHSVNFK